MAAPPRQALSPAFSARELNGEHLLEEVSSLRQGQVRLKHLDDCAVALRSLRCLRVSEAVARVRQIAGARFGGQPALGSLLVRWAMRLRTEADVDALVGHFERLALVASGLAALWRAKGRADAEDAGGSG